MKKIRVSLLILISVALGFLITLVFNIERKPTSEEIEEYKNFSDQLVSSLNSDTSPLFSKGDMNYTIEILLSKNDSLSKVVVTIDNKNDTFNKKTIITYPAKITGSDFEVGISYKTVKFQSFTANENFIIFTISTLTIFSLLCALTIIIVSDIIPKEIEGTKKIKEE